MAKLDSEAMKQQIRDSLGRELPEDLQGLNQDDLADAYGAEGLVCSNCRAAQVAERETEYKTEDRKHTDSLDVISDSGEKCFDERFSERRVDQR